MQGRDAVEYSKRGLVRLIWYAAWLTTLVIFFVFIGYGLSSNKDTRTTILLIAIFLASLGIILTLQNRVLMRHQKKIGVAVIGIGALLSVLVTSFF